MYQPLHLINLINIIIMKKLNLQLWVFAILFFAVGCVKDDDAEYDAAMKAQQEEIQPQLVTTNEPTSTETQVVSPSVTTPATPETREVTPKEMTVKQPATEKNVASTQEVNTPITEKPLYNTSAKKPATTASAPLNAPEVKPKATPQEITMRGGPSATQTLERGVNAAEANQRTGTNAAFSIDKMTFDFGNKTEGEKVVHVYTLTNTGNTDLYIQDVVPSCNCTVPDFDFDAIKPGKSTELKVVFDTNGKVGTQRKTIRVITNAGERTLTMVGTVFPKSKNY